MALRQWFAPYVVAAGMAGFAAAPAIAEVSPKDVVKTYADIGQAMYEDAQRRASACRRRSTR